MNASVEKTIKSLEDRGYTAKYFATGAEAAQYMAGEIKGRTVGMGGCTTAKEMGLYELLSKENTVYWHWEAPGAETMKKANNAEVYITGANAIAETGEILNIDGRGNRLAGQVFGEKKLYVVAGINKICPDFDSALYRARNVASVKRSQSNNRPNPCTTGGKCYDCRSKERICNALLVLWAPMREMESEVILIGEELGM